MMPFHFATGKLSSAKDGF